MARIHLLSAVSVLFALLPAIAQDTVQAPHGHSGGTAFDERAPATGRIGTLEVNSGALIDGIKLQYEHRNGSAFGTSAQLGQLTGITTNFAIPDGDYLTRIDVWANGSYIVRIALETAGGLRTPFGGTTAGTTRQNFLAPAGEEIVGLVGTYGALMNSLGVVTRPVLASHVFFGTGCPTSVGRPQIRYNSTYPHLILGGRTVVEVANAPPNTPGFLVTGFSSTTAGSIPLPLDLDGFGMTNCQLYTSVDLIHYSLATAAGVLGTTLFVPSDPAFVGFGLTFQGFPLGGSNPAGLAASNALTAMVGAL
ncbi:MAG: hypothetical protein IPK26_11185 [Planctomycetes bacterium]|nr:hypothetical protein [Planctomycetota bacterium]